VSDKPIPPSVAEHALISCLSENGANIGMVATIAQQAELLRLQGDKIQRQAAELHALKMPGAALKQAGVAAMPEWLSDDESMAERLRLAGWVATHDGQWSGAELFRLEVLRAVRLNASRDVVPVQIEPTRSVLVEFAAEEQFLLFCDEDEFVDIAQSVLRRFAAPTPAPARCEYCDGTGDVHSLDGEWRGECTECKPDHSADDIKMVMVPRELANRITSTDNHVRQTARRELRNMLMAGCAQ